MDVNIEYYKVFYNVAILGSMGKAAEEMMLTPPTITKTIQNLEEQLNCQLFIRSVKGVTLTDAGHTLLKYVQPGLQILNTAEKEVCNLNSLEGGTVSFVTSEAVAYYLTEYDVLGKFCTAYPKIKLIIRHMPREDAIQSILNHTIDFAILGLGPNFQKEGLSLTEIYISDNIPVVGKPLKKLAEKPISLEELSAYPLIFTHAGFSIRSYYENMFRKHNLEFSPNIETPTLDLQLKAIKRGLGYSFVPYPHIKKELENGELFKPTIIGEDDYCRVVTILTPTDAPLSKAAQAFISTITDVRNTVLNEQTL